MGTCARERNLTERQQQFIAEYLDCRQTVTAALRAGYSEKTARHSSWRLLRNPQISRKIEEKQALIRQRQAVGRDEIVAALAQVAFVTAEQEGEPVRTADRLRALDILSRIMGLYGAKNKGDDMPDLAEQLRRARLRVERMKKEDEEKKRLKEQRETPPVEPENLPVVEEVPGAEPPPPPLRAKDIPFVMGRHPESPFPLDPVPSSHTGWQNFEFDPYEY